MTMYRYHILGFVLGFYMVMMCRSYEVFFGLKGRSDTNQYLFNGETNVIITCNVTCLVNASIQIDSVRDGTDSPIVTLKEINQHGHFLDLTIARITKELKFRCLVKDNDATTDNEVSKEILWSPHIIQETDPVYCRRNGTVSQPYKIGDILLLECFCNLTLATSCLWISDINATLRDLTHESVELRGNLHVYRLVVGPITAADESTRYECLSSPNNGISRPCVINARKFSTSDYVFNPIASFDCDTVTDTSTEGSPHQSTNGIHNGDESSFKRETIIFIGVPSFIVILIFICVVSAVILIRKNKCKTKYKADDNGNDYYATTIDQNQVNGTLPNSINPYGSSRFMSDKANHSSPLEPNDNSNIDASEKDNYGYSVVNKKGQPHSTRDTPEVYDYDIVPKVGTEAEIDLSDLYSKVQK